jgi:transcriptional regulator with XRE-family HTH domain
VTPSVDLLPNLPERLRELRHAFGWSMNDLAVLVGVTQPGVVSNWETKNQRRRTPELSTLLTLQRWYGVSMDYLLGLPHAERDSGIVKASKKALLVRLMDVGDRLPPSPSERARLIILMAIEVSPEAFFKERVSAFLTMKPATLGELLEGGMWPDATLDRLADLLGIKADWFYLANPTATLMHAQKTEGRT